MYRDKTHLHPIVTSGKPIQGAEVGFPTEQFRGLGDSEWLLGILNLHSHTRRCIVYCNNLKEQTMGHWRFRRSVGPKFLKLNVSKTGLSMTSGVPGAHVNVPLAGRKRKPMVTLGLPGTGLSYRQPLGGRRGRAPATSSPDLDIVPWVVAGVILVAAFFYYFGG